MKLPPRDANAYFAKPDPTKTGLLIYGGDAMRVALKRQSFLKNLLGHLDIFLICESGLLMIKESDMLSVIYITEKK